ncbi:hypothetical protein [Nostoc sp.]
MKRFLYRCILLLSDADERLKSATAEKLERITRGVRPSATLYTAPL